jgi:hypothetical protein
LDAVFVYGTEIASFLTMGMDSMDTVNRELPVPAPATRARKRAAMLALAALAMAGLATAAQAGPLVPNGTFSGLNAGNNTTNSSPCYSNDTTTVQLTNCDLPNWYWTPGGSGAVSGTSPGTSNYTFILNAGNYTSFPSITNGTLALKQSIPTPPDNGVNWLGADGAFQTSYTYTTVTGLVVGGIYTLTFYMGAGQQNGNFTGTTTSTWQAGLSTGTAGCTFPGANSSPGTCLPNTGTTTSKTPTPLTLPSTPTNYSGTAGFVGWASEEVFLVASATTEVLWFLAVGTPGQTQPPFALLDGVSMILPEPPAYGVLLVGLLALMGVRRVWRGKA